MTDEAFPILFEKAFLLGGNYAANIQLQAKSA
jgi:hypothetical protein